MYSAPGNISCQYCGGSDVVTDYAAGDIVCRGCGSVLGERLISEEAEWREYDDDDRGGSGDAARASYSDSSTYIVGGNPTLCKSLNRAHMAALVGRSDVRIGDSATHLTDFAAKLGLSERIAVLHLRYVLR
jgi:transcription initiation factor TFIIIB Brf1 subunit/transcription initiation factor TFIIB